jgi:spermidine synthase
MRARPLYLEALLVALATILFEVSCTRVFSYKLVYYFTYLIIGIALLGLGAGGVFVAVFARLRALPVERLVPRASLGAAAGVLAGYWLTALVQLNAFDMTSGRLAGGAWLAELAKLVLICLAVFVPFLCAGLVLATIFSRQTGQIAKLYFADLVGAALGCAFVIPLLVLVTPPGTVMLAGACFAAAGLRLAFASSRSLAVALLGVGGATLLLAAVPSLVPDPVPDRVKTMAPGPNAPKVLFSRWSPVFRVDVAPGVGTLMLMHDGTIGSFVHEYHGDLKELSRFDHQFHQLPFRILPPQPKVAIIGAAGGHEILASLWFDASHVTAIELNPVTWSIVTDRFADFGGHLAQHPKVDYVNAEGRSYLGGSREKFDLIWLVAPDSYAAMNAATSGAFVLSESYLYTEEMILESLDHLTPAGVLCASMGEIDYTGAPNRTLRYLATARSALRRIGIEDFASHVLVATSPGIFANWATPTVLLKRTPFSDAERQAFVDAVAKVEGGRVRHDGLRERDTPVDKVIRMGEEPLANWYKRYRFQVGAIRDDAPFFWHFVPFGDAFADLIGRKKPAHDEGVGEKLLLVLLLVAVVFAAAFLLLPLLAIRRVWREIPYKPWAGIYFAALGTGFMLLEVSLIQRLTLFLGYPTYSLTVTLFALLLSTALGSLMSERFAARRNRSVLVLGVLLAVLVVFYAEGLPSLAHVGLGWPLALRIATTVAVLLPLGLCLGMLMPLGLRSVAAVTVHSEEYVAWSWAVNGFFSVVSSVLATILSMTFGFSLVMTIALAIYLVGIAALLQIPEDAEDGGAG